MASVMQSDVFFFITSISVVVLSILLCIALIYAIRVLRDVRTISSKVKEEGDMILKDISDMRHFFRTEGARLAGATTLLGRFLKPKKHRHSEKGKENGSEKE